MKKIIFVLIYLFLCHNLKSQTQNFIWSLPSNYGQNNGGGIVPQALPTPPAPNPIPGGGPNYSGVPAQHSHNAMQDANGNLLFFIVDGGVYNAQGHNFGYLNFSPANEIVIVPVPGSCTRYYVMYDETRPFPDPPEGDHYSYSELCIIDVTNPVAPFVDCSPGYVISALTHPFLALNYAGLNHYAASKLRPDNTRFVYVLVNGQLVLVQLDALGFNTLTVQYPSGMPVLGIGTTRVRAEMELVEYFNTTFNQMRYKIAAPIDGGNGLQGVYYAELDYATGNIIGGTEKSYMFSNNEEIKGLEFSPNQDYLYITHTGSNNIEYFDVNAPIFSPINMGIATAVDFQFSQLELATDGHIYMAGKTLNFNNRLASINNPNTPLTPGFNDNALPISYNSNATLYNLPNHTSYVLPDQVDDMDYTDHFFINLQCCLDNNDFDVAVSEKNHEFSTSGSWSYTGTNPWNATAGSILVKDKMIIKSGTNITITGMTFEFAHQAQLIIERGASLTLDNCSLTVNNSCVANAMWHGIEVWGTTGSYQPIPANRGILVAKNNTVIEHARVATSNFAHNQDINNKPLENSVFPNFTGGIIQATNTIFRNNHKDTQFENYQNTLNNNTYNDLSYFRNCHFLTDALLNNPNVTPLAHAFLRRVKGIKFQGCTFENTTSKATMGVPQRGYGIFAFESLFSVKELCSVPVPFPNSCPSGSTDKCEFNNLNYGIIARNNGTTTRTAQILNANFNYNFRGILLRNMDLPEITDNLFNVDVDLSPNSPAYGIYLWNCDQYKVENNILHNWGGTYGVYVNNSGGLPNEIYRNAFYSFKTASQTAQNNGLGSSTYAPIGLEFRCNFYSETVDYDILVSSGRIKSYQGNCSTPIAPANNQFSYTASQGDYWVNNPPATNINARYRFTHHSLTSLGNLSPRSVPLRYNTNNTILDPCNKAVSCLKKQKKTKGDLIVLIGNTNVSVGNLKQQIDGGDTQNLLNEIATSSGGSLKNTLLAASPYLSDDVLIAYAQSNPSNGHLKQIMIENSPLEDKVFNIISNMNLPNGIFNQIANAQTGVSARRDLEEEINYLEAEISRYNADLLRIFLFDENEVDDGVKEVIAHLDTTEHIKKGCVLASAYIDNADLTNAQAMVNNLNTDTSLTDYCNLYNSIIQYEQHTDKEMMLLNNNNLLTPVQNVSVASTSNQEVGIAQSIIEMINHYGFNEPFETVNNNMRVATNDENKIIKESTVNIYPNPTSNQFTLAHNYSIENGAITLILFDMMGRIALTKTIVNDKTIVNTIDLKQGVYFYKISQANHQLNTGKLIIE